LFGQINSDKDSINYSIKYNKLNAIMDTTIKTICRINYILLYGMLGYSVTRFADTFHILFAICIVLCSITTSMKYNLILKWYRNTVKLLISFLDKDNGKDSSQLEIPFK